MLRSGCEGRKCKLIFSFALVSLFSFCFSVCNVKHCENGINTIWLAISGKDFSFEIVKRRADIGIYVEQALKMRDKIRVFEKVRLGA